MKQIISIFLIVFTGFTGIVWGQTKRPIAAIKDVIGIVKLLRADTHQKIVASMGNLLYNGDAIITESSASIAILFTDGSMLKVQENSEVTLTAQRKDGQQVDAKVDLPLGEIWAKVTRRDSKFEVETPSSVASVKGTEFSVMVDEGGTSTLFVYDGLVEFQNELGSVIVKRNQKSVTEKDKPPEEPQKLSKKDKEQRAEVGAQWKLEIKAPSGKQAPNQPFQMQARALNPETNRLDVSCNSKIVISSTTSGAQFSLDGNAWSGELQAQLASGELTFYAKARTTDDLVATVSGDNCQPGKATVSIEKTRQQKLKESERVISIMRKLGIGDVEGLQYKQGELKIGTGNFDDILSKIDSGEFDVVGFEIVDTEDGKKIILRVKPAAGEKEGGGPGGQ